MMKANQHRQKLKAQPPPRPLFSCAFFRHCTQSPLSPTSPHPPSLPPPRPPLKKPPSSSSSSSSSASTSQSFTQWRLPLHHHHHLHPDPPPPPIFHPPSSPSPPPPPPLPATTLQEIFHLSELRLTSASDSDKLLALQLLERSVVPDPPSHPTCPPDLMRGLVACLRTDKAAAKYVTKILLALCLAEGNRLVAVEVGAAGAVVETAAGMESSAAERALAALELMCMVPEGAEEVRAHALSVPAMVAVMARLAGRGREYAISVLAVVYGAGGGGGGESGEGMPAAPAEEVARAVALALQGECTARGKRKGAQLLKTLEEYGRLDLSQDGA